IGLEVGGPERWEFKSWLSATLVGQVLMNWMSVPKRHQMSLMGVLDECPGAPPRNKFSRFEI
ncbi:MAG: hypothetical protein AAF493_20145, partial [Pseudomonadota bacterium]